MGSSGLGAEIVDDETGPDVLACGGLHFLDLVPTIIRASEAGRLGLPDCRSEIFLPPSRMVAVSQSRFNFIELVLM